MIVICPVQFLWMTSIHHAPHRPLSVTAADVSSGVTGKEHPTNPWIPNKDQDETVSSYYSAQPISCTLPGCLHDSDKTKAEQHPFLHQRDIDLRSQQSPDRKSEALMGTSRQCQNPCTKSNLGFRANALNWSPNVCCHRCINSKRNLHATECNRKLWVLFDTTYTTCCHPQSTFWSHQSYVVAAAGPEVLVAPGTVQ